MAGLLKQERYLFGSIRISAKECQGKMNAGGFSLTPAEATITREEKACGAQPWY